MHAGSNSQGLGGTEQAQDERDLQFSTAAEELTVLGHPLSSRHADQDLQGPFSARVYSQSPRAAQAACMSGSRTAHLEDLLSMVVENVQGLPHVAHVVERHLQVPTG